MRKICVFVGATVGHDSQLYKAAQLLGQQIARKGYVLVYGGANIGLMGVLADAALKAGGQVEGVIPKLFEAQEITHKNITKVHVVDSMQERKAMMANLSGAFIALPGGLGTLEEVFEVWNAVKIGLHTKPLCFFNVNGYYDKLFGFLDDVFAKGFMKKNHYNLPIVSDKLPFLLNCIDELLMK